VPEKLVDTGCAAHCEPQTPITACANGDSCCPEDAWCSTLNDNDCDNAPAELVFTTGVGSATCGGPTYLTDSYTWAYVEPAEPYAGAVRDTSGNVLAQLGTNCLYLGGGNAHVAAGRIPTGVSLRTLVASAEGSTLHLVAGSGTSSKDCTLGLETSKHCLNESDHPPCSSDEDCEGGLVGSCAQDARCRFGPPIPLGSEFLGGMFSSCLVNVIRENVSGTTDLDTGDQDLSIPLASRLYRTGVYPDACPLCTENTCVGGENNGDPCTATGAGQTSIECMPDPTKYVATVVVDLAPINTATAINDDGADFCPNQENPGAFLFSGEDVKSISLAGSAAGNLANGEPHAATVVSTFCVPASGAIVDDVADLPGPGAISIAGELQIVRP
jgi:hypothetical protein